jgi:ribosome-associated protein
MPTRGRRLHFNNEVDTQRRLLLASIASLSVRAFVVVCHRRHGVTEFAAREACLQVIVSEVQALGVARLVVESRQDDSEDRRIITNARQPEPLLVFEHRTARHEPMLGLADAITWAIGAGANWQAIVEPVLLDVRSLCSYCNYQLVVSGRSDRQVEAISESILTGLREQDIRPIGTEGKRSGQWALLDFGDFVVHVFHHPLREHYDLEGLWVDAPRLAIEVPADARVAIDQAY